MLGLAPHTLEFTYCPFSACSGLPPLMDGLAPGTVAVRKTCRSAHSAHSRPSVSAHKGTRPPWLQGGARTGRGGRVLSSLRVALSQLLEPLLVDGAFASETQNLIRRLRVPPRCECFSPTRVHSSRVRLAGRFKVFQPRRSRRACCVLRVGSSSLSSHLSVVLDFLCVSLANSLADWTGSTRRKGLVLPRTFESQWDASHRFPSVPPCKGSLGYPLASRSVPKLALTLQRVKSLISSLRRLVGFLTVDGQPNKKFGVKKKAV